MCLPIHVIGTIRRECWTERYFGQWQIWRQSFGNSKVILMATVAMRDWEVDCQNRDVTDQHHRYASLHTGGGSTSRSVSDADRRMILGIRHRQVPFTVAVH